MSSLDFHPCCYSKKWGRGVTPRFHLVVFVYRLNRLNITTQGESKIPLCNPIHGKLVRPSLSYNKLISFPQKSSTAFVRPWMWSFQIMFHEIKSFRIISKITVNRKKKWFEFDETPPQILFLEISEILINFSPHHPKPSSKLT